MLGRILTLAIVASGLLVHAADDDEKKPRLTVLYPTVQLPGDAQGGVGEVYVRAENFSPEQMKGSPPDVRDLKVPAYPNVVVKESPVTEVSRVADGGVWLCRLTVRGLPKQASQNRKLLLVFGGVQSQADYTLTNKSVATFAWTIPGPPVWTLIDSRAVGLPVIVKDVPATGVRLLHSTLQRSGDDPGTLGVNALELCAEPEGEVCTPPATIPSFDSRTLYLRVRKDVVQPIGTYTGNVLIASDEKPEGETVALTLYATTGWARFGGLVAVAVGVLLFFLTTIVARYQMAVNDRVALALRLRLEMEALRNRVHRALTTDLAWAKNQVNATLNTLSGLLDRKQLKPHLPTPLNPDAKLDAFKQHVESVGKELELLRVVIELGLPKVQQAWNAAGADTSKQQHVQDALRKLLAVPGQKLSVEDTRSEVEKILTELFNAVGAGALAGLTEDRLERTLERTLLSTMRWTWLVIGIWALATVLTGALLLVWAKPGFGVFVDYAVCVLWGLGLPAAGQQLNQLTAPSIGTGFGISLPKVSE